MVDDKDKHETPLLKALVAHANGIALIQRAREFAQSKPGQVQAKKQLKELSEHMQALDKAESIGDAEDVVEQTAKSVKGLQLTVKNTLKLT